MTFNQKKTAPLLFLLAVFICARAVTAFAGQDEITRPAVIESGQVLSVHVYDEPDLSRDYIVNEKGVIEMPLAGEISVIHLTLDEAKEAITAVLKRYIIKPQLVVKTQDDAAVEGADTSITILGQVLKAGSYPYQKNLTLTKVIALSGGLSLQANPRNIKLIRQEKDGPRVSEFDMNEITDGSKEDPAIERSDKIIVPQMQKDEDGAVVLGEVERPGMFDVVKGATLVRIIAKAGGFKELADKRRVRIVREEDGRRVVMDFDVYEIMKGNRDDPEIKPYDKIFVPETFF